MATTGMGFNTPRWIGRPLTHITPMSLSDGATFERKLDWVYNYITNTLLPELNGVLDTWFEQYKTDISALSDKVDGFQGVVDGVKDDWQQLFDQFMADVVAQLEALNDQAAANLVNNETSAMREALDYHYLKRNGDVFFPEDYWNAEVEPTNYSHTFRRVLEAAQGKPVILQSGKIYPVTDTITPGTATSIDMRSSGAEPAYIDNPGQSRNIIHLQPGGQQDQEGGVVAVETTLIESRGIDSNGWLVSNPTGIEPGMICAVISNKLWYHDPRPGEGEARKSELHLVTKVVGSRVYFEAPAQDGYSIAKEVVTLKFYNPMRVRMDNITLRGTLPAVAEETPATMGLRIDFGLDVELNNVSVEETARTGIYLAGCYRGIINGGYSKRINNYYNGYGVSIAGCTHTRVTNRTTTESRRAVDFSTIRHGVISRNCVVDNSRCVGGGANSRGENYGWNPDGSIGAYQAGFGSHGGVDNITYRDNETYDLTAAYTVRGRNSYVLGNTHYGRCDQSFCSASFGVNLYVENNRVLSNYWGMKDRDPYNQNADNPIDRYRCATMVTIYETWDSNPAVGTTRGQLRIMNNHGEVRQGLLQMHLFHKGETYIVGNYMQIAHPTPGLVRYFINLASNQIPEVVPGLMRLWYLSGNAFRAPNEPEIAKLANFSLEGCNYNGYTELGATKVVQSGIAKNLTTSPPYAAGTVVQVVGNYEKFFKEPPMIVFSSSVPVDRINVTENSLGRFVADVTLSKAWNYAVDVGYMSHGLAADYNFM